MSTMDHYQPLDREVRRSDNILYCRFFLEGNSCSYGDDCKYPHIDPMSPAHINDSIPILVEHIPLGTKESDLMHLFSQYGTTTKVEIVYEGSHTNPFCVAHVDMIGRVGAQNALKELNQWDNPNQLRVTVRGKKSSSSGGGAVRRESHAPGNRRDPSSRDSKYPRNPESKSKNSSNQGANYNDYPPNNSDSSYHKNNSNEYNRQNSNYSSRDPRSSRHNYSNTNTNNNNVDPFQNNNPIELSNDYNNNLNYNNPNVLPANVMPNPTAPNLNNNFVPNVLPPNNALATNVLSSLLPNNNMPAAAAMPNPALPNVLADLSTLASLNNLSNVLALNSVLPGLNLNNLPNNLDLKAILSQLIPSAANSNIDNSNYNLNNNNVYDPNGNYIQPNNNIYNNDPQFGMNNSNAFDNNNNYNDNFNNRQNFSDNYQNNNNFNDNFNNQNFNENGNNNNYDRPPKKRGPDSYGSRGDKPLKRTPCKHFLAGNCHLGNSCTYLHDASAPQSRDHYPKDRHSNMDFAHDGYRDGPSGHRRERDGTRTSRGPKMEKFKTVPCQNFALGACAFGDNCSFIH